MEGIELAAFNIITAVGEAKSKLVQAVEESKTGNEDVAKKLIAEANESITIGDKEHFKLISEDSKNNDVKFSLLLVHAEDQLMSAETFRDFATQLISTNISLYKLQKEMDKNENDLED